MERDFVEMSSALNAAGAEYLVVGAHSLSAHGVPRATGDLDIWVRATPGDARRTLEVLRELGAPLFDLSVDDLARPEAVFQIGVVPVRIDLLRSISGVSFEEAGARRLPGSIEGVAFGVLGREDLLRKSGPPAGRRTFSTPRRSRHAVASIDGKRVDPVSGSRRKPGRIPKGAPLRRPRAHPASKRNAGLVGRRSSIRLPWREKRLRVDGSAGKTRTYNPSVNSRMLYH